MSQADQSNNTKTPTKSLTRRDTILSILTGTAAAASFTGAGLVNAHAAIDPVYAAIAHCEKAEADLHEIITKEPNPQAPEHDAWEKAWEPIIDTYSTALDAAFSTVPATREGAIALIDLAFKTWSGNYDDDGDDNDDGDRVVSFPDGDGAVLVLSSLRSALPHLT